MLYIQCLIAAVHASDWRIMDTSAWLTVTMQNVLMQKVATILLRNPSVEMTIARKVHSSPGALFR